MKQILFTSLLSTLTIGSYASQQPNVIIVLADDVGYGDHSCYGNPRIATPNIDAMHDRSVRLTDFHTSPVSTPTRGSLLTGMDPMHNGAWSWGFGHEYINPEITTMPMIFRDAGYKTAHFGKWHLGDCYPGRPQDIGFETTVTYGGAATHQTPTYWQGDNFDDYYLQKDGTYKQYDGYCTDVWFDMSFDFMRECKDNEEPFLLYLPLNAAHTPFYVDEKYSAPFADLGEMAAANFGMISTIDENMGRLDEFLKREGLYENSIVIYFSDNGANPWGAELHNAGMRGRKSHYYDGGHRVACFVEWPEGGLVGGVDLDELTTVQDLLPTIMDLCSVKAKKSIKNQFDGVNLTPYLRGEKSQMDDRMVIVKWSFNTVPNKDEGAILWSNWRLVGSTELYDIDKDPAQQNDISSEHPEIVAAMLAHYDEWWDGVQEVVTTFYRPIIGGEVNPVHMTCNEWINRTSRANVTEQQTIWDGENVNGELLVRFDKTARYRFTMRRYPVEADFAMRGAYPATQREFIYFEECRAMPIYSAEVDVDGKRAKVDVGENDKYVSVEMDITRGDHSIKSFFYDADGNELSGSYYLDVERL